MKILLPLFATFIFFAIANASLPQQIASILSSYNVPSSIMNMLTPVNITYNNNTYTALYSNGRLFFLINDSNGNFVLNTTQIYLIIRNNTIANSYYSINKQQLLNYMHAYQNSSQDALNYCLFETGLNQYTCNVSNSCYSCQTVPSCNLVMYKNDGIYGSFAQDIMKLQSQYHELNASFNTFYSSIESMNTKNAAYNLALANSAFMNISNMTKNLIFNGLFPPTPNITNTMMAQCEFYPNPNTAPWYCYAFGYCEALTYNYSLLNKMSNIMAEINTEPFQESQIYMLAYNASLTEERYIAPVLYARKTAQLNSILNVTLANYSSIVNGSELVLSHISNSSLSNALSNLAYLRNYTISNYMSINLTQYNKTLSSSMKNLTSLYDSLNSTYLGLLSIARNNTAILLKEELNTQYPSQKLEGLSLEELNLNNEINGKISNLSLLSSSLASIYKEAKSIYTSPFGLVELARLIDGPFARSIATVIPMPYSANVELAPLYSMILSLLIGVIFFGIIFLIYMNLRIKRRIIVNKYTARNWHILFAIIWIIILIYAGLTYLFAYEANSFAPISAFDKAVAGSHYIVIALNGTTSLNQFECGSMISKNLLGMGKSPVLISISNNTCTVSNKTISLSTCMNYYAQSNIPVIILTNSNTNLIKPYSFYGSYLEFMGNESAMNACYASLLLR
ncbi:MAG: hypothetical protein ACP5RK_02535 [Candidatus Micrarchaeia archaeon]